MAYYQNASIEHTWHFIPIQKKHLIQWRWERRNGRHQALAKSASDFNTFTECLADAKSNGYIEPTRTSGPSNIG
jgi:hypothetical protein